MLPRPEHEAYGVVNYSKFSSPDTDDSWMFCKRPVHCRASRNGDKRSDTTTPQGSNSIGGPFLCQLGKHSFRQPFALRQLEMPAKYGRPAGPQKRARENKKAHHMMGLGPSAGEPPPLHGRARPRERETESSL